ncbi:MAG: acetolactate synthase large subunit, partial [bacterium]|nr:acetolactate synthase large subunit [bacterium]
MSKTRPTAAANAMRAAADAGVELCFANPGTTELALVEALDTVPEIRAVLGLFEGVCTGAADGYGRMSGKPALTLLHLGPGFANGIANLHNARRAQSPVVNLIGDQASWHRDFDAPLTSDIDSLAAPVSDWLHTSRSAKNLEAELGAAIRAATGPPRGVSTLIIPADHQSQPASEGDADARLPETRAHESRALDPDAAAERVRAASRVALLLGGNALSAEGQRIAGRIAKATHAKGFAETFPARWERGANVPAFDRLPYFPEQARQALGDYDAVIIAGARAPVAFFGYEGIDSALVDDARVVLIAEPADDAHAALEALARCLGANEDATLDAPAPSAPDLSAALDPGTIGAVLAHALPDDAIVMEEGATSSLPFYLCSPGAAPHSLMTLTGGAIGQGMPCATGAALACPDRKVINLQADGSGMYTLQSLWTQAREGLDVVTLLCSNHAYRILQVEFGRTGNLEPGPQARSLTNLSEPELDWVALARGCGVPGVRIESVEALHKEFARALAEPGPQLLELMI